MAFAPDALTPLGGYPGDEDKARDLFAKLDPAKAREDFVAAARALRQLPECSGKTGAVGFCYDTTPRYGEAAAALAWGRTVALFNQQLR